MGKIAFVFAGQGGQYSGMGKSLMEVSPAAEEIFDISDSIRPGTGAQCFEGSEDELKKTVNTQPCIYTVDLAAAEALRAYGVKADMVAGFSLGEIAALTFSGAISREEGFELVCKRGELMQAAGEKNPGAMIAVFKLSNEEVERLTAENKNVYPVNYNCPGQIIVSGKADDVDRFKEVVKNAGGKAVPLKVSGSFHSPLMNDAYEGFKSIINNYEISQPEAEAYTEYEDETGTVMYSNRTGKPYEGDMRDLLCRQIISPVLWQSTIEHMISCGADTFIEVGPGKTLSGLISKISGDVKVYNVQDAESLDYTLKGLGVCLPVRHQ